MKPGKHFYWSYRFISSQFTNSTILSLQTRFIAFIFCFWNIPAIFPLFSFHWKIMMIVIITFYRLALILDNVLVVVLRGAPPAVQGTSWKRCSPDLPVYYYATSDNLLDLGRFRSLCLLSKLFIAQNNFCWFLTQISVNWKES